MKNLLKTFGDFCVFEYNILMKRLSNILILILFVVPTLFGVLFLHPEIAPATLNGGGGANSLNSPLSTDKDDISIIDDDEAEQSLEPTIRPKTQYFLDFEVSESISGRGSSQEPWQINSFADFLCLVDTKWCAGCYVELNCDLTFNEEVFDKDGNVSGGDGIVYNWNFFDSLNGLYFEGNGHTISGLYMKNPEDDISTFIYLSRKIENLTFKNCFVNGKKAFVIGYSIAEIRNVRVIETNVSGEMISGFGYLAKTLVENCENYANLYQDDLPTKNSCAGLFLDSNTDIFNCKNYGNFYGHKVNYYGGIVSSQFGKIIKGCKNYGQFQSDNHTGMGGIVGIIREGARILNCENFADAKRYSGGIVGYSYLTALRREELVVENCSNYGDCYESSAGMICYGYPATIKSCVNYGNVTNASGFVDNAYPFLGSVWKIHDSKNYGSYYADKTNHSLSIGVMQATTEVVDCVFDLSVLNSYGDDSLLYAQCTSGMDNVVFKGIKIKLRTNNFKRYFMFATLRGTESNIIKDIDIEFSGAKEVFLINKIVEHVEITNLQAKITSNNIYFIRENNGALFAENVVIYHNCLSNSATNKFIYTNSGMVNAKGVVWETKFQNGEKELCYVGSDFSGIVQDWKTGKFHIKYTSGKGLFQGKVTEEYLLEKGFEKIVI